MPRDRQPDEPLLDDEPEPKEEIQRAPMDPLAAFLIKVVLPGIIAFGLVMLLFGR